MEEIQKLKILTKDEKVYQLNLKIAEIVKLINNIVIDYDLDETILLDIHSEKLEKIIHFSELIEYKPLLIENKDRVIPNEYKKQFSKGLLEYYENLTQEEIVDLLTIADFMEIPSLDNLCIIKMVEIFRDKTKINDFFGTNIHLEIDKEREVNLREKYIDDYKCDHLSNDQIVQMLDTFEDDYS